MKAISLFAGAGGCSLGFLQSGVDVIAAYDSHAPAMNTYNQNFGRGKCKNVDLAKCDFVQIRNGLGLARGEIDLVIGGPPCQGFTTAGNRSLADARNQLVSNYAQALRVFSTRWFVMENVEGILTTAGGHYLKHFLDCVISLGYSISMEKIYAHEYGVPQRRKRVFIVGNSEGIAFSFPRPVMEAHGPIYRNGGRTLRHAILDLENASLPEIDHAPKQEKGVRYARIAALGAGQAMGDLPEELQHDSYRRRANRRVCDGTPSEKRGGPPSGLKRLLYDEPALTITGSSISEFVHPRLNRTLTVRECARIQTFPDDFAFCGTECQKAQQIGNAIPPLLARSIAEQIKTLDSSNAPRVPAGLVYYKVTKSDAMVPLLQKTCAYLNELAIEPVAKRSFATQRSW